jgi:hypothetical protein
MGTRLERGGLFDIEPTIGSPAMKSTSVASFVVRPALALAAAAALTGCASSYQLTLMPRNSGTLFYGDAVEQSAGGEAIVTVNLDEKIYTGNWVPVSSGRSSGFVSGGIGWGGGGRGRYGGIGVGTAPVVIDNGEGAAAKALLQAADGSGLRCDFRGLQPSSSAGGTCQDDKGLVYDVQIRLKR